MNISRELSRAVRERANGRCQYCLMHESLQGASFHIEHVIPHSRGGLANLGNLVLACPGCNLLKGSRVAAILPHTGENVPLFHPILQSWSDHFSLNGYQIEGLTPEGRVTIVALNLNHPRRRRIRQAEETFGLFPPFL